MSDKRFVLAGVMGWPVAHTRSPAIHNHWIAKHELKGAYVQLPVQPEKLEAAIRGLSALGFAGCNVTVPHKVNAMKLMDELTPAARHIAAINTIVVRPDGSLLGANNDGNGYIQKADIDKISGVSYHEGGIVSFENGGVVLRKNFLRQVPTFDS